MSMPRVRARPTGGAPGGVPGPRCALESMPMPRTRTIPKQLRRLPGALAAMLLLLALNAAAADAASPKPGTYTATTSQCGSAAHAHPRYTFTIKIAKSRCLALGGRRKKAGYCVTFSYRDNSALVFADVTCPDSTTFQSQLDGPQIPLLLSPAGTLRFAANSAVTEAGKELVVGVQKLMLSVKGSHVSGTLSVLAQENIGDEPPTCTTGTVTFTAKRS